MRCKVCDYRLWNIAARFCPECGEPFKPSEHQFKRNGVKFCCPGCGMAYYGTGENGHLHPLAFDCVQCGRHVHMDDMVLQPAAAEQDATVERNPWTQRVRVGFWYGFTRTVGRGMTRPAELIEATPESSSLASAWWYVTLLEFLHLFVGGGAVMALPFIMVGMVGGRRAFAPALGIIVGMVVVLALSVCVVLAMVGLWVLAAHFVVKWRNPDGPRLRRTTQAMLYSAGPLIVCAIPCVGAYFWFVGYVWWMVSAVFALGRLPNVSSNRATVAALLFPAVLIVLGIVATIIGFAVAAAMGNAMPIAPPPGPPVPVIPTPTP